MARICQEVNSSCDACMVNSKLVQHRAISKLQKLRLVHRQLVVVMDEFALSSLLDVQESLRENVRENLLVAAQFHVFDEAHLDNLNTTKSRKSEKESQPMFGQVTGLARSAERMCLPAKPLALIAVKIDIVDAKAAAVAKAAAEEEIGIIHFQCAMEEVLPATLDQATGDA